MALAPDIDYAIPALQASHHNGLRITHSIFVSLLLPLGRGLCLLLLNQKGKVPLSSGVWWRVSGSQSLLLQAICAGSSHLLMDLLVGVTPLPLLWPLFPRLFKLPFGLLPSAGRLQWGNALLYQNLGIELGVMVPVLLMTLLAVNGKGHPLLLLTLSLIAAYFMMWAAQLAR
ncbi:hypothetical protein C1752_03633 [Acaryochloris thomasi RCC1774]|uniref:Uncharacterized protein n=2 Tax=Acaryochloris TaxID=155977 RepID=A0A2W1JFP8_9CYAN|nr:hypothetical protein C1752_03633 [Acaryochloris thomasi RCC1774]